MAKITQRLIAAGASPERARAFEQQFTQRLQGAQPGARLAPREIQDAFDTEVAAAAAAIFPNVFKVPKQGEPGFDDYASFVWKDKWTSIPKTVAAKEGPNYTRVESKLSPDPAADKLDQTIVRGIKDGVSQAELLQLILINRDDLWDGLTEGKVGELVSKYYTEYDRINEQVPIAQAKFLDNDKYYKYNLVDPNFAYGTKQDIAGGVIDFRTHPSVARILKDESVKNQRLTGFKTGATPVDRLERRAIEQGLTDITPKVFAKFQATGATPFSDEVKRREVVKKASIK